MNRWLIVGISFVAGVIWYGFAVGMTPTPLLCLLGLVLMFVGYVLAALMCAGAGADERAERAARKERERRRIHEVIAQHAVAEDVRKLRDEWKAE